MVIRLSHRSPTGQWRQRLIDADWVFLTHWGWDKMAAILQTTFSNAFSWMKMLELWLKFQWSLFLIIGIDHDTVCAGVVCAATPGTARVGPAVAPAGPTSAVPGVAVQTTTAQTVWVVNFYSTTKTKQYTMINPAMIMTMSRHAETPWLTMSLWRWKLP